MSKLLTVENIENDVTRILSEHGEFISILVNKVSEIINGNLLIANVLIYEYLIDAYYGSDWTYSFAIHTTLKPERYLSYYTNPVNTLDFSGNSGNFDITASKKYGDTEILASKKIIQEAISMMQAKGLSEDKLLMFRFTVIDQLMKHYCLGKFQRNDIEDTN